MNYYGAKELAAAFRTVRKNTIIIAEEIPEDQYGFRPSPGARTVSETLVHVAISPRFPYQIHAVDKRSNMEGFDFLSFFGGIMMIEKEPHTKARILALLKEEGDRFAGWLEGLSEEFLAEMVQPAPGFGAPRSRFEMLLGAKEHEMHHRGGLMVIERMLGVTPHLTRQMEANIAAMQASAKA
jgi:uncharacterized damage-inducible protein DinB